MGSGGNCSVVDGVTVVVMLMVNVVVVVTLVVDGGCSVSDIECSDGDRW